MNLPRWKCHKEVSAFNIRTISMDVEAKRLFLWPDEKQRYGDPVEVSLQWFAKHAPEVGGYYVRYDDGYESYSPAGAFEAGYTLIA